MPQTNLTTSDATITAQVIQEEGAMKAYQSVAQSAAIAVQDATDSLRNINTISSTAIGVAMAQMLADPPNSMLYKPIVESAQGLITTAAANFLLIGENAASVLKDFPTGQ